MGYLFLSRIDWFLFCNFGCFDGCHSKFRKLDFPNYFSQIVWRINSQISIHYVIVVKIWNEEKYVKLIIFRLSQKFIGPLFVSFQCLLYCCVSISIQIHPGKNNKKKNHQLIKFKMLVLINCMRRSRFISWISEVWYVSMSAFEVFVLVDISVYWSVNFVFKSVFFVPIKLKAMNYSKWANIYLWLCVGRI